MANGSGPASPPAPATLSPHAAWHPFVTEIRSCPGVRESRIMGPVVRRRFHQTQQAILAARKQSLEREG
jgi:hypothetical protein